MRLIGVLRLCAFAAVLCGIQSSSVISYYSPEGTPTNAIHTNDCQPLTECIEHVAARGYRLPPRPPPQSSNFRSQFNQRAAAVFNRSGSQTGLGRPYNGPVFVKKIVSPANIRLQLTRTRLENITTPPGRAKSMPAVVAQSAYLKGLARHEGQGKGQGGHTIAFHVGLTDGELKSRLSNPAEFNKRQDSLPAVSSFTNGRIATRAIAATMWAKKTDIKDWLKSNPRVGQTQTFEMPKTVAARIGTTGRRIAIGEANASDRSGARMVLQYQGAGKYIIYSAYPGD